MQKKTQTYREYLKATAPVNLTGKNRYGVSRITEEKVKKLFVIGKSTAELIEKYAARYGITQADALTRLVNQGINKEETKD